jgi:hypothetical protein
MTHFEVFLGLRLAFMGPLSPPAWVQIPLGVDQLYHCCVSLPQGTHSIIWCYHVCRQFET